MGAEALGIADPLGLTAAEVSERLGEPNHVYLAGTAPEHDDVDGWGYRERPLISMVHIFILDEPTGYVWYDEDGRVEDG